MTDKPEGIWEDWAMFVDFSKLPSDVALVLSQQNYTEALADDLGTVMNLDFADRGTLHQEIVGSVAEIVDGYLARATDPHARP